MTKNKSFILSDESVNTYGFRLLTAGADLEQFRRNPVMYMNHADWSLPIGRWENIRVDGERILADPVFDMDDEAAREVAGKVERGFLKMASVGLRVKERSEDTALMLPGQNLPTITKWQLREVSIVGIGANHNAVRLFDENDKALSDEQIIKLFDNSKPIFKTDNMNKELLTLLGLADTATNEQLHEAVKLLLDEKKNLADKLQKIEDDKLKSQNDEAVKLTDKAIREGRLNASAKEHTLSLFDKDFDGTKAMLEAIPERKTLKDAVTEADKTELEKLSAKSWDELDKNGDLRTLKDKYPDVYKEKFDEKFKK